MKVNYFDLGLFAGWELDQMLNVVFPELNITDYNAYGFEACKLFHQSCQRRFSDKKNVNLYWRAIADNEKAIKLFYAKNQLGHSIFEGKNKKLENKDLIQVNFESATVELNFPICFVDTTGYNEWIKHFFPTYKPLDPLAPDFRPLVAENEVLIPIKTYEYVKGLVFSKWIKENVPDFKNSFNIIKVNIEGAEWHLFNDLINNNMIKDIDVFCGSGHDVEKIPELKDKYSDFLKILDENNIKIHRFTEYNSQDNANIATIIYKKMKNA